MGPVKQLQAYRRDYGIIDEDSKLGCLHYP
jgi:hypothetical protein